MMTHKEPHMWWVRHGRNLIRAGWSWTARVWARVTDASPAPPEVSVCFLTCKLMNLNNFYLQYALNETSTWPAIFPLHVVTKSAQVPKNNWFKIFQCLLSWLCNYSHATPLLHNLQWGLHGLMPTCTWKISSCAFHAEKRSKAWLPSSVLKVSANTFKVIKTTRWGVMVLRGFSNTFVPGTFNKSVKRGLAGCCF